MSETLYRRPPSSEAIAFSSLDGRQVFAEALSAGGLDGYFPLRDLPLHRQVIEAIGEERAEAVTLLMLAIDERVA